MIALLLLELDPQSRGETDAERLDRESVGLVTQADNSEVNG